MSQTILFVCATGIATSTAVTEKSWNIVKSTVLTLIILKPTLPLYLEIPTA